MLNKQLLANTANRVLIKDEERIHKFFKNQLIFTAPAILIYLYQVQSSILSDNFVFSWGIFVPTQLTIGGILSYFIGFFIDYLRKLK